jgi:hydroxymethylbilane synthase
MITIGSRGSALALVQTEWVKKRILELHPDEEISIKVIRTSADGNQTASLRSGSTVGVFVRELEQALTGKEIDIAVHSMKDVPTQIAEGLRIAAIPQREDPRDALVANRAVSLEELPDGSLVGTGSVRRQAQILAVRPGLRVMDIRGNVDTRLKKLESGAYDAVILACAGLRRLSLEHRISSVLDYAQMLPAPAQGALAIEIRSHDSRMDAVVSPLNDPSTAVTVLAERHFLLRMGGGCNIPVAAYARLDRDVIEIDGLVASLDGRRIVRDSIRQNLEKADSSAALLADRILSRGGREILEGAL